MTGGSYARSDYCPIQAAYSDSVPTADPSTSVWQHTAVVPDDPGSKGIGASANQFSTPVVDDEGGLDVGFVSEDCNTVVRSGAPVRPLDRWRRVVRRRRPRE
jgi:hypothetical protein